MKALVNRLRRLEGHLLQDDYSQRPRERSRMLVRMIGGPPGLEGATCNRTLAPDGSIWETIILAGGGIGLSEEELDRFADQFPVTGLPSRGSRG